MLARALAIAALLLTASSARADDASAGKELYERGVYHFNLGEYDAALEAFRAAYTPQRPEILFNIAQCLRKLKRFDAAADAYKAFLATAPPGSDVEGARRMAREMEDAAAAARAPAPPAPVIAPPAADPPLAMRRAPPPRRSPLRTPGIGLTGAGAGLLVAGGVFAGVSAAEGEKALHRDVYDYDADQRREAFRGAAIASFVIGGAAVIAGVTLWTIGRRR
jgi:tetratricopeptide (TPR) repeat protein